MIHATLMALQQNGSDQRSVFPDTLFPMLANALCLGKSVRRGDVLTVSPNLYKYFSKFVYAL